MHSAVVELYKHVLPGVAAHHTRKLLTRAATLLLLLPDGESVAEDEPAAAVAADADESSSDEEEAAAAAAAAPPDAATTQRLVGAVSFEVGQRLGQCLLQVSLLGVRVRYQREGVGGRLLDALLRGDASGARPDAAIAWADLKAVGFFRKHGFRDDAILNARYREISDPWERSTLMSAQLPPRRPESGAEAARSIDDDVAAWRHSRLLEYSKELAVVERMASEIAALREKAGRQESYIAYLTAENARLRRERAAAGASRGSGGDSPRSPGALRRRRRRRRLGRRRRARAPRPPPRRRRLRRGTGRAATRGRRRAAIGSRAAA